MIFPHGTDGTSVYGKLGNYTDKKTWATRTIFTLLQKDYAAYV